MKKGAILVFISLILFMDLILANPVAIKADGKEYSTELIAVNRESAIIKINNENKTIRTVQSSPYIPESFSSALPGLKYVLTDLHYPTYLGDIKYVNLLILIEKNLSISGTKKAIMSYGGTDSNVEVSSIISGTQANLRLNNGGDIQATVQSSPYAIQRIAPLSDLMYVLTSISGNSITLLSGFEINLVLECTTNWDCSQWGPCADNKQIRICKDKNNCGSKKNMPVLNQSCASIANETNISPSCKNECQNSAKTCFNQTSYKICMDTNNDNCTEWSSPIFCSNDSKMVCINDGNCAAKAQESKNNSVMWLIGIEIITIIIIALFKFKIFRR